MVKFNKPAHHLPVNRLFFILLLLFITVAPAVAQVDYQPEPPTQPVLVKDSAGIDRIQQEFKLKLSRKPNKDLLVLKVQKLADRSMDFKLTSLAGEELAVDISRSRNNVSIDLTMLPAGDYVLNILDYDAEKVARVKVSKGKL